MRVENSINPIPFQKKLKADCAVTKWGEPQYCRIYELDLFDNRKNYLTPQRKNDWRWGELVDYFFDNLNRWSNEKSYVLEDEQGACLGILTTSSSKDNKTTTIEIIESTPKRKEYGLGYIGETLVGFVVQKAKEDNMQEIYASRVIDDAKSRYMDKWGFIKEYSQSNTLTLKGEDFDKFLEQNRAHTGLKIHLMA